MINQLDIITTRRLSYSLLAGSGALLLAALQLVGAGVSSGNIVYSSKISESVIPLAGSTFMGFLALVFTELAAHPNVPVKGHPHSKENYLQSAFVYLGIIGAGLLIYGGFKLISAAVVL